MSLNEVKSNQIFNFNPGKNELTGIQETYLTLLWQNISRVAHVKSLKDGSVGILKVNIHDPKLEENAKNMTLNSK